MAKKTLLDAPFLLFTQEAGWQRGRCNRCSDGSSALCSGCIDSHMRDLMYFKRQCGGLLAKFRMLSVYTNFLPRDKGNKQNPLFPGLEFSWRKWVWAVLSKSCYHQGWLTHYHTTVQLAPSPWDPLNCVILPNCSTSQLVVSFPEKWRKVKPNIPSFIVNFRNTLTSCIRVAEYSCEKAQLAFSGGLGMRMQGLWF